VVLTGLTNGTTYNFRVRAINAIGASVDSAASNAVTPVTLPDAPAIGTAVAGNASATVTWTAPASNGGSAVTSYELDVLVGTTVVRTEFGIAGTATSTVVTGLTNGTTYSFRVRAVTAVGTSASSATSNTVTPATPATAPGAPTIGTAVRGNASATVNWTAPTSDGGSAITSYQVQVRTGATVVRTVTGIAGNATSTVVTGLTNGTTYNFRVQAVNAIGTGVLSAASNTVTPATVPGAPAIGSPQRGASGGALTAIARWSPPAATGGSAITGYRVTALRMSSTAANATVLSRTDSPVLAATARSREFTLAAGNYRFEVVAINAVGTSAASARSANVVPP
jgi:hypothetical protein